MSLASLIREHRKPAHISAASGKIFAPKLDLNEEAELIARQASPDPG